MPLIWKRIVLCVSIVLVVYGAVRLIGYLNDLQRSRQTTYKDTEKEPKKFSENTASRARRLSAMGKH